MIRSRLLPSLLLFLLAVLGLVACGPERSQDRGRAVATEPLERLDPNSVPLYPASRRAEAQDFSVTLLGGERFSLSGQQGKVVLLNIWATWCSPCHTEAPDLQQLHEAYGDDGLVVLGISLDDRGASAVRPFMERYGITYPMYIDKADTVMDKYGPTMAVPTSYILGKQGEIRYFATGAVTRKELEPRIRKLLEE